MALLLENGADVNSRNYSGQVSPPPPSFYFFEFWFLFEEELHNMILISGKFVFEIRIGIGIYIFHFGWDSIP